MRFKKAAKAALPESLWLALRAAKQAIRPGKSATFEGIYRTLDEVSRSNPHTEYDDADILLAREKTTRERWERAKNQRNFPEAGPLSPIHNLLPLLAATLLEQQPKVRLLDFGGGLGDGFMDCCASLAKSANLEFHVVEMEKTASAAKKIFSSENRIFFHSSLPESHGQFDIVYAGSSLQYINDYATLLEKLAGLSKRYLFLTNNFMSEAPTYATAQKNMGEKVIPYWIFNREEIMRTLENQGMQLAYRSANFQPFHNFHNFPATHRAQDSCNLLFVRR